MSLQHLHPLSLIPESERLSLGKNMRSFYLHPPANYYPLADQAADKYTPQEQPFHCHLAEQISRGDRVLEVGCGSAHFCPVIQQRGGSTMELTSIPICSKITAKNGLAAFF